MCLITNTPVPSIAEQDIECYKVYVKSYNDSRVSPYRRCPMPNINELVTTELQSPVNLRVDLGFHSFSYFSDAEFVAERFARTKKSSCVVKCIIPKGTEYYLGKFGFDEAYCSESIILKEIIKKYFKPSIKTDYVSYFL